MDDLKGEVVVTVGVVVAAAGQGKRMRKGFNKQFIQLGDRPILMHTLQAFEHMSSVEQIVVVTSAGDIAKCEALCRSYNVRKVTDVVAGGKTRQDSVRIGLNKVRTDWVLVHDGARPFVSEEMVNELLESAQKHGAAVLGVPVKDTIKKVNVDGIIEETPERKSMWAVQTPQAFRLSELKRAHARAREEELAATDDAMLMEHLGFDVRIVRGDYYNIKITTPEDLWFAESILQHMRKMGDRT